jgi:hypothetical protein
MGHPGDVYNVKKPHLLCPAHLSLDHVFNFVQNQKWAEKICAGLAWKS